MGSGQSGDGARRRRGQRREKLWGKLIWSGGYADVVWLPYRDRVRLSIGPEVGFLMFGVDGGPLPEIDEHRSRAGVQVRPLLSFLFVHLSARFGRTFQEHGSAFGEVSSLLKYPIDLKELRL